MQPVAVLRSILVAAIAVMSARVLSDSSFDLGKHADGLTLLKGYRAAEAGAPIAASEAGHTQKLLFERTYLKEGLMLRFYGLIFASRDDLLEYTRSQQRSMGGVAVDIADDSFRAKGIRLIAFGSREAPARTARATVNRIYLDGLAIRTDHSSTRPISVALAADDLAVLRSVMAELMIRAKRMPENKRP